MIDKLKGMFREEDAMGSLTEICLGTCGIWCNPEVWGTCVDIMFCGGRGMLRGGCVPVCNTCIKELAKLIGA